MSEAHHDPSGIDEPHDILAAEEFEIGTRDKRHPPDPTGIEEPHDVLAAEEFAMPAPDAPADAGVSSSRGGQGLWLAVSAGVVLALLLRRRR